MPSLRLEDAGRAFGDAEVLARADITIGQGEFVAIEGPSGSGKSTLLNLLGLLDRPTHGRYRIGDVDTGALGERQRTRLRSATFAFVFQSFHLLDRRAVVDSVELGRLSRGLGRRERRRRALAALASVGLAHVAEQRASLLSGGERQRVAIARALAARVPVILADEPTGNLDSRNTDTVVDLLRTLHRAGATVVVVTHDPDVAAHAGRWLRVVDGRVVEAAAARHDGHEDAPATLTEPAPGCAPTAQSRWSRSADVARDALANVTSRAGRTAGLVTAVGVAVGLSLATVGLSQSAAQQVKQTFDARSNRDVAVSWGPGGLDALTDEERGSLAGRLGALRGVAAVALVEAHGEGEVAVGSRPARSTAVYSATAAVEAAARLSVAWAPSVRVLGPGQALIGEALARQLQLAPLSTRPVVRVGAAEFEVVGTVISSPRIERLPSSVLLSDGDAGSLPEPQKTTALILTTIGAARQVSAQAPLVVDPYDADALSVQAPPDPRNLRDSIEGDVRSGMLALSLVALAAAVAGVGSAMTSAVMERRWELGLRRALGAQPGRLFSLLVVESAIVGAAGGAVGLAGGVLTVLGVTLARRWTPVIDPAWAPAAVLGGVVVGAAAGVLAAARASRTAPSDALRQ